MILLILKTLHVLSIIIWTSVLLYVPRLLIYQTEASSKTEPERSILINQFKKMTKNLWYKVGWPAAILTIIFGFGIMHPYFSNIWFWVKMGLVVILLGYHHIIHFAFKALQKDKYTKSVDQLNSMHQAGMVLILSIVFVAVFKTAINNILIMAGTILGVVLIVIAVRALIRRSAKSRQSDAA
jgi:putative membrane protein